MNRGEKILGCLYLVALVTGILAVVLPYWVSTTLEHGTKEVEVSKRIDSGLFLKYERFEADPDSFPESDDGWKGIRGTDLDTKGLERTTGLVMTGIALLVCSLICTYSVLCCVDKHRRKIAFALIATILFVSALFIAIGQTVFFKQVLDDYRIGENDEHLGWSFLLASTSAIVTFLAGLFTIYLVVCGGNSSSK